VELSTTLNRASFHPPDFTKQLTSRPSLRTPPRVFTDLYEIAETFRALSGVPEVYSASIDQPNELALRVTRGGPHQVLVFLAPRRREERERAAPAGWAGRSAAAKERHRERQRAAYQALSHEQRKVLWQSRARTPDQIERHRARNRSDGLSTEAYAAKLAAGKQRWAEASPERRAEINRLRRERAKRLRLALPESD
jgi:hypothetical protein